MMVAAIMSRGHHRLCYGLIDWQARVQNAQGDALGGMWLGEMLLVGGMLFFSRLPSSNIPSNLL
jgi:hypothetical protein